MPHPTPLKGIGVSYGSPQSYSPLPLPSLEKSPVFACRTQTRCCRRRVVNGLVRALRLPSRHTGSNRGTGVPKAKRDGDCALAFLPAVRCGVSLTGRHHKQGMSGWLFPVRLGTLRGDSPWQLSATHCVLETCFLLTAPFRSMLLTLSSGRQRLTPRAHGVPVYPRVLPHSYFALSRRTVSINNVSSTRYEDR